MNLKEIEGKRITRVRPMTEQEKKSFAWCWGDNATVIELEGGTAIIPMRDEEGNGPGAVQVCDLVRS